MSSERETDPKQTALIDIHREAGARLVPFAGYEMPLYYEGILVEHKAVRQKVGLFDVSHMGRIIISGNDSIPFVNFLTTNNVAALVDNQAQYSAMCNEKGGVRDDILVYRFGSSSLLLVVNAANHGDDWQWLQDHQNGFDVQMKDITEQKSLLALQGPKAQETLSKLTGLPLDDIDYYHFTEGEVAKVRMIVSRTGYTGEDGFELFPPAESAPIIWKKLIAAGQDFSIKPCGLGARNTLRLEMGYALHGHEISQDITPFEAGLGWITKLDKGDFIGKKALLAQKAKGPSRRLVGIVLLEPKRIPRDEECKIIYEGEEVGQLVSGTYSPSLEIGIGTGFVPPELAKPYTQFEINIQGRHTVRAQAVKLPFYQNGTHR